MLFKRSGDLAPLPLFVHPPKLALDFAASPNEGPHIMCSMKLEVFAPVDGSSRGCFLNDVRGRRSSRVPARGLPPFYGRCVVHLSTARDAEPDCIPSPDGRVVSANHARGILSGNAHGLGLQGTQGRHLRFRIWISSFSCGRLGRTPNRPTCFPGLGCTKFATSDA